LNSIAGDCWLVAAIESLRHHVNQEFFSEVVQAHGDDLEFRWGVKSDNNFGGGQILDPFIQLQ
jgi:aminopeptidase C